MKGIPLSRGYVALVDDTDFDWLSQWKWHCTQDGYAARRTPRNEGRNQGWMFMHRLIMNTPAGMFTDHINHNKLDNRRSNLRICTTAQNIQNIKISKNNTSGFIGVDFFERKSPKKWRAQIRIEGVRKFLGYFMTPEEAGRARDLAAIQLHKEFAALNFQREDYP